MPKLSIVIPVYNEKGTIEEVLRRVDSLNLNGVEKEVIVVDDCSDDGTREILRRYEDRHKVVFLERNFGKGYALRRGFREAKGDIVLIQDADLEYSPEDYPRLIGPILREEADAVYGSRFLDGAKEANRIIYKRGYLFSRLLNSFSNALNGAGLSDIYTCYKVLSKRALDAVLPRLVSNRFGIEVELTAYAAKKKMRIVEVPISYQGRTYEEGKKINWKDGLAAIWHIIRFNLFS